MSGIILASKLTAVTKDDEHCRQQCQTARLQLLTPFKQLSVLSP